MGRFSRYPLAGAVSTTQVREKALHLRRRVESRAVSATYVINDLPMRLRDTRFALKLAAGLGAVILLFAVYSSASSPASTASAAMFSNPAGIVTTPTATATTASATTASAKPTTTRRQTSATVRRAGMTPPKRSGTTSQASRPRTTTTKSTTAAKPATNAAPATVTTPAQTTTQTVTVTTPAPATPAPAATKTTPVSTPPASAPPLGTLTNAAFSKLPVNQITRGVIISVFGAPATAKQLQSALGTKWLTAAAQGLQAGISCVYYFDRSGKAQTFQLCFDASNMLVLKQALKDSAASGSA